MKGVPNLASRGNAIGCPGSGRPRRARHFLRNRGRRLGPSDELFELAVWSALVAAASYVLFSDGFTNGQSLGKRAFHIAVIDASTGEPCTFARSLIRNLLLVVFLVIDWLFIFGKNRQRLGDIVAQTIVVNLTPEIYLGY